MVGPDPIRRDRLLVAFFQREGAIPLDKFIDNEWFGPLPEPPK